MSLLLFPLSLIIFEKFHLQYLPPRTTPFLACHAFLPPLSALLARMDTSAPLGWILTPGKSPNGRSVFPIWVRNALLNLVSKIYFYMRVSSFSPAGRAACLFIIFYIFCRKGRTKNNYYYNNYHYNNYYHYHLPFNPIFFYHNNFCPLNSNSMQCSSTRSRSSCDPNRPTAWQLQSTTDWWWPTFGRTRPTFEWRQPIRGWHRKATGKHRPVSGRTLGHCQPKSNYYRNKEKGLGSKDKEI